MIYEFKNKSLEICVCLYLSSGVCKTVASKYPIPTVSCYIAHHMMARRAVTDQGAKSAGATQINGLRCEERGKEVREGESENECVCNSRRTLMQG